MVQKKVIGGCLTVKKRSQSALKQKVKSINFRKNPLQKEFLLNKNEVINNLCQSETPNKDLAEFAIFCFKYKDYHLMDPIIKKSISKFTTEIFNELKKVFKK